MTLSDAILFRKHPKDPSVLKIVRRANSLRREKFGTEVAKRYGECSEVLVFPGKKLTCFHASFFPFCPLCWPPLSPPPFSGHLFALCSPSKSALFCRAKGTAQILGRGTFRTHLSTKFGKEIPSRNLREKRSERGRRTVRNVKNYGGSKILWIWAPYYF